MAWIGLLGVLAFTLVPLLFKKVQTDEEKRRARRIVYIVIGIIIAVIIFKMSYLTVFLIGFMAIMFVERRTYSRKQLIIFTAAIMLILFTCYFLWGFGLSYRIDDFSS